MNNKIRCNHKGGHYEFKIGKFILNGEVITAEEAAANEAIMDELIAIGAGCIIRIGDIEAAPADPTLKGGVKIMVVDDNANAELVSQVLDEKIQVIIDPTLKPSERLLTEAIVRSITDSVKSDLATEHWKAYHDKKLERKKLSSQTHDLVSKGATSETLTIHYQRILLLQDEERQLYNRAQYVEKHGKLPEQTPADQETIETLKLEKRRLIDLRSKLGRKIKEETAKNLPEAKQHKLIEWQLELDQAEAEYKLVEEKINKLRGK